MMNVNTLLKSASKITSLPIVKSLSKAANSTPDTDDIEGYLKAQRLAHQCASEIASMLRPGWSEAHTAELMNTWLNDHGVDSFFHKAFVWFGDRTRFDGVRNYFEYLPSKRVLRDDEVFILDIAPIVGSYICDIGYSGCIGINADFEKAHAYLINLRERIPEMFSKKSSGAAIWAAIDQDMMEHGYENIHAKYPFSVLGHRIHKSSLERVKANFINFGWQSYWEFISRGVFGQLLNQNFEGDLTGLWAIEPHIGTINFGAKFEEILLVKDGKAEWLDPSEFGLLKKLSFEPNFDQEPVI